METNSNIPPDISDTPEQSDLYAFGMLSAAEAEEFERKVLAGEVDANQLDESLQTLTALCEEISSVMPAPRRAVKDSIMAAIAPEPDGAARAATPPGMARAGREQFFLHADEGEWVNLMPGISIRVLHDYTEENRTLFMVRLAPGAKYPTHRHAGLEECLVLEGDLHVDGHVLRNGDFTASYADTVHVDTHSEGGCVLLISSPLNDEFIE